MSKSIEGQLEEILGAINAQQKSIDGLREDFTTQQESIDGLDKKFIAQQESIDGLTQNVALQQKSIDGLTQGFSLQQSELAGLREEMRAGFKEVREELHKQGTLLESVQDDLRIVVEATSPEFEKRTELQEKVSDHDAELVQHGLRLTKLENA